MNKAIWLACVLAAPCYASAACEPSTSIDVPRLSPEKFDERARLYREVCEKVRGDLIDADNANAPPTLIWPRHFSNLATDRDPYPEHLKKQGVQGVVVVSYTLDKRGRVDWVSVIESSGNAELDNAARIFFRKRKFTDPATVAGMPVRVFRSASMEFKLSK
jgi:TonB family protein